MTDRAEFNVRMQSLIDEIHAAPTATGIASVLLPGEREFQNARNAAQHGINVRRLSEARYREVRAKAAKKRKSSAFVPVKVRAPALSKLAPAQHHSETLRTSSGLTIQARLANGVVLNWTSEPTNASAQANLLHTLAGLPCFD